MTYSESGPYMIHIKQKNLINQILNKNMKFKKDFSPLSGSEKKYNPDQWNKDSKIKGSHNCYSYALGKRIKNVGEKPQPGYASGFNHGNTDRCSPYIQRLQKDSPGSYIENFDNACLPGFYKIFLALDKGHDYHWYRQNSPGIKKNNKINKNNKVNKNHGYWSHKPGLSDVTNVDADGKLIKNPATANRNYPYLNYDTPCFFACVNSDLSRALAFIYKK